MVVVDRLSVTRIGRIDVPVRKPNLCALVRFKGSRSGWYAFWTAVLREGKRTRIIGRARVGLSAGDRFDRMEHERVASHIPVEDRPVYADMWRDMEAGANVRYVRASTQREIEKWLRSHPREARSEVKREEW